MKWIKNIALFGLLILSTSNYGGGKCSGDAEYKTALTKLGGFNVIKDYRVTLNDGEQIIYPVSLTNGLKYKFIPVNNPKNAEMVMSIYAKKNLTMLLATTYNSRMDKHYEQVAFQCRASGVFYLVIEFKGKTKGCGTGVFSVQG